MIAIIITALIGGFSTFYVHTKTKLSAIKSSVICTLVFFAITTFIQKQVPEIEFQYYQTIFFGSTFIGMSSSKHFNMIMIGVSTIIFAVFFKLSHQYFCGIGGALGTSASLTVIIVYFLRIFFTNHNNVRAKNKRV